MANGGKKGGEVVLESRHLIGLFLLMVLISGVVFTLGYVLGRSQYEAQFRAAASGANKESPRPAAETALAKRPASAAAPPAGAPATPAPSDWDFYRSAAPQKTVAPLGKSEKPAAAANKTAVAARPASNSGSKTKPLLTAPLIPKGAIVLQVAALRRESDALALAEALQQKKFPAFVLTPGADQYYRVQVGPYADAQSANLAKRGLEHEGFKAIVRR